MAKTLKDLCYEHGLRIKYEDCGISSTPLHGKKTWHHKSFSVTLSRGDVKYGDPFSYHMGIPVFAPRRGDSILSQELRREKIEKEIKERIPTVVDIVASLLTDASCYDSAIDFADYCSNFGESDDSIRARDTYLACGETSKRIRHFLGDLFQEFAEAAQEY